MRIRYFFVWTLLSIVGVLPVVSNAQVGLTWEVTNFDIVCKLPADFEVQRSADFTATLQMRNRSPRAYDQVTLRINEAAVISDISVDGTTVDFRVGQEKITANQNLQRVQMRIKDVQPGASAQVSVKYKLNVASNSGLMALSPTATQFLPYAFWYPAPTSWYYTEGADSAPFKIRVEGLGDRQLVSAGSEADGTFSSSLSGMPFFATGNWIRTEHNGVFVYAPKGIPAAPGIVEAMAGLASEAKAFAEARIGKKIPVPLRIVSVSRGSGFSESGTVFVDRGAFTNASMDSKTAIAISEAVMKTMLGNVVATRGDWLRRYPRRNDEVFV